MYKETKQWSIVVLLMVTTSLSWHHGDHLACLSVASSLSWSGEAMPVYSRVFLLASTYMVCFSHVKGRATGGMCCAC